MRRAAWLLAALMAGPAAAQRLYEKSLEEQAQQAARAAAAVSGGSLFEKQLRNLETLSAQDFATWLGDARNLMRARIDSWRYWRQVDKFVEGLKAQAAPPPDLKAQRAELEARRAAAAEALRAFSEQVRAAGASTLADLAGSLGEYSAVYELGKTVLASSAPEAAGDASRALAQLEQLYAGARQRLERLRTLEGELAGLRLPLERVNLELLQVDEQHLAALSAVRARRARETAQVRDLAEEYAALRQGLGVANPEEGLEVTLQRLAAARDRERLERALRALYAAAALATRGATPAALADLREAQEERRYSIRRSAVAARAYELALGHGARLLALYYQGGVRPAQVVELIFRLTGIATLPVIAAH